MSRSTYLFLSIVLCAAVPQLAFAQPPSEVARTNTTRSAYFGELHLHTSFSWDAYLLYGTQITPDEAYRFGRGESISYHGHRVQRPWPLDFMAVTDHAEGLGVLRTLNDSNSVLSKTEVGRRFRWGNTRVLEILGLNEGEHTTALVADAWEEQIRAANRYNRPGSFTTFIAYEWTSGPDGNNLHRNVIFRGDSAPVPFSSADSQKPEDLWSYLEANRRRGIEALAIPHNANASNGLMYDWSASDGHAVDRAYALRRASNEPLAELIQVKGQSETHPALSPYDEFANFEVVDHLNGSWGNSAVHGSYIREAYGRGLLIEAKIGVNPYRFGVVGASDLHNGLSSSDEANYGGVDGGVDTVYDSSSASELRRIVALRRSTKVFDFDVKAGDFNAYDIGSGSAGLTGVWSEENTRSSIFEALRRKETFATSGTRLTVRFFGGWQYTQALLQSRDWATKAYAGGAPMGSHLPPKPAKAIAPQFLVWALKDPSGANLDRIQVIKVWLDDQQYRERVFDVTWSGGRQLDARTGRLPGVGNTVDLKTATFTNSIGATELWSVWEDPEFDSAVPAVYYLRVLEIPTPRWSTIQAVKGGLPLPEGVPATIQERGWSSPIWFTPSP